MKVLTKPVKSRLSSPRIYGYEATDLSIGGLYIEADRSRIVTSLGGRPVCVSITTYYECWPTMNFGDCEPGTSPGYSETINWGPC